MNQSKFLLNNNLFNKNNLNQYNTYLLGYLCNSGYVSKKKNILKFKLIKNHEYILTLLKKLLNKDIFKYDTHLTYYAISINSKTICDDFLLLLDISNGKNFNNIKLPNLYKDNSNLFWNFINGYLDYNASLELIQGTPECDLLFNSNHLLKNFHIYIKIPHIKLNSKLKFSSTNCIDFLGEIYKYNDLYDKELYNKFENFINWKYIINSNFALDACKIIKTDKNAILPSKHYESDVGYDLTIIKKVKNLTPSTILYDTGLKLNVDYGYYIEIVPRSSLSKSGYMLANSIGIIEKSYSGNLYVALTKIDKEMPDLELPFRCCQLIFKPQISLKIIDCDNIYIEHTTRNSGGFGSSNIKK